MRTTARILFTTLVFGAAILNGGELPRKEGLDFLDTGPIRFVSYGSSADISFHAGFSWTR
jgi:hypothetical protein